jgi:hypothetical protein
MDCSKRFFEVDFKSIPRQFRDRNHHKVMLSAEPDKVGYSSHGSVVLDDLADHAGGV